MQQVNPYQPPAQQPPPDVHMATGVPPLAGRMARLGAAMIDAIALSIINFPLLMSLGLLDFGRTTMPAFSEQLLTGAIGFVVFTVVQGYFLANGQTIGKRMLGLKMVDALTGQPVGFGKLLGLRYLPTTAASLIPVLGGMFGLIDALFIFRDDRRCLHDLIAGTKVIDIEPKHPGQYPG